MAVKIFITMGPLLELRVYIYTLFDIVENARQEATL
jgi:hypothetical protein